MSDVTQSFARISTGLSSFSMAHVDDQQFEEAAQQTAQLALAISPPVLTRRFLLRVAEIVEQSEEYACSHERCSLVCEICPLVCARGREKHNHCRCFFQQMNDMVPVRASIAFRRQHSEVEACSIGTAVVVPPLRIRSRSPCSHRSH